MKCKQCSSEWPEGTKFCGGCGAELEPSARLGSTALEAVNQQLKNQLPQIGLGPFNEVQPGIHLCLKGSSYVQVRAVPMGDSVAVRSMSPVTFETPITEEVLRFLLTENAKLLIGAFGVGPQNEILYSHTIMASSMDAIELGSSVSSVVNMADKYDDEIVRKWGGKTARKVAPEQSVPPPLLKALLALRLGRSQLQESRAEAPKTEQIASLDRSRLGSTPDVSQAIAVKSVEEEYEYLARERCSCGGGYVREAQALVRIGGRFYDQMTGSCTECGDSRQFLFDINSFFAGRLGAA